MADDLISDQKFNIFPTTTQLDNILKILTILIEIQSITSLPKTFG